MSGNIIFSSDECELQNKQIPIKVIHRVDNSEIGLVMHSHEFIEIGIVINGEADHVINIPDDKIYYSVIKKGDVFLIDQGESHYYSIDKGHELEIINIIFDPSIISELLDKQSLDGICKSAGELYGENTVTLNDLAGM